MTVQCSETSHFNGWLKLAREVEPLFGPMADDPNFQDGLRQAILQKTAFCVTDNLPTGTPELKGGIIIIKESNEIAWLAVSQNSRGCGWGKALLQYAMNQLDPSKDILVQTFAADVPEGRAARALYQQFGFKDFRDVGQNPAGIPTVIMGHTKGSL